MIETTLKNRWAKLKFYKGMRPEDFLVVLKLSTDNIKVNEGDRIYLHTKGGIFTVTAVTGEFISVTCNKVIMDRVNGEVPNNTLIVHKSHIKGFYSQMNVNNRYK